MKVTTKSLLSTFKKLDPKTARVIVRLCNGTLDPETFEAGADRVRECYNPPSDTDVTLHVINSLLGGHGVESVPYEQDAMHDGDFIEYVNFGDTYAPTVLFNPAKSRFEVSAWGDAYEGSPAWRAAVGEDDGDEESA